MSSTSIVKKKRRSKYALRSDNARTTFKFKDAVYTNAVSIVILGTGTMVSVISTSFLQRTAAGGAASALQEM